MEPIFTHTRGNSRVYGPKCFTTYENATLNAKAWLGLSSHLHRAPGRAARRAKRRAGPRKGPARCVDMKVPSTGQRRPALPRASPAVPSALGGLASGFGMGPGVPRPPWPLTGGRRSAHHEVVYVCPGVPDLRALGAAQRGDGPSGSPSDPTGSIARHPSLARRHPRRYEMLG